MIGGLLRDSDARPRKSPVEDISAGIVVPCVIDIESSRDSLHAHVDIDGIEIGPGDVVVVHSAPAHVAFGTRKTHHSRATVLRAGPLRRLLTRLGGYFALTELFEVSFSSRRRP